MDKYTIDITFFDLNGSLKTLEFTEINYEQLLETYAFTKAFSVKIQDIMIHIRETKDKGIPVEDFLFFKLMNNSEL